MKHTPTDQQRAAIETTGKHLCVDAGAGSGKTSVLVDRVLHLLRADVPLRQIVAITFTRKAAGEMRERLRRAIHDAADENDPASMSKWRTLEYQVESARISTIDSFCASLLRENALRIGLDPEFTMLAEAETALLRAEVAHDALERLLDAGDEAAHRAAAEYGVFTLVGFLHGALSNPTALDNAAREYTGLDADALAERWRVDTERLLSAKYDALAADPDVHRWLADLASLDGRCTDAGDKRETVRCAMVRSLRVIRDRADNDALRHALGELASLKFNGGSKKKWLSEADFGRVSEIGKEVREFAEEHAEPPTEPDVESHAAQLTLDVLRVHGAVGAAYSEAKAARNALDFADLLARTLAMIETRPELRDRVAEGVRHLLIDEFQDTNHAQLSLARGLAKLAGRAGAELFVVGDAKQSIYRFRGAEVGVFAEARGLVDETLPLDENFRSVPEVIAFVNEFFAGSGLLRAVEPAFHGLVAKREAIDGGCIEFLVPPEIDREDDDSLDSYRAAEAQLIAARIAQMCGPDGVTVFDKATKSTRPARYGDAAILVRTRSNVEIFDAALRRAGIPTVVLEGAGFYTRQEVLDLHNLFAAALDPWNEFALAAFLRGPLANVSDDALMELTRGRGLADAVMHGAALRDADQAARISAARELLRDIWSRREMPLASLVRYVLARTGFEAVLLPQYHGVQKAGNLRKLVDLAENFSHTGRASLAAFTEYLRTVAAQGLREGDAELFADTAGAVTLMSVHSAKGLEFPIVFIADTATQTGGNHGATVCRAHRTGGAAATVHNQFGATCKPRLATLIEAVDKTEEADEEARVLYVAMTRARDRLVVSAPPCGKKGTWSHALDVQLGLFDRDDGAELAGKGWSGHVTRQIAEVPAPMQPNGDDGVSLDLTALRAQARPLDATRLVPTLAPASAILDRLHAKREADGRSKRRGMRAVEANVFGTLAHALLEQWDFACDPPIDRVLREHCPRLSAREAYRAALGELADGLRASSVWLRLSAATNLRREVPFVWRVNGVTVRGTIDAVADGDFLLDYKTGVFDTGQHARYATQLEIYAAALADAGAPVREAFVFYVECGRCEPVDVSKAALAEVKELVAGIFAGSAV